jgi:hypothetical protein
MRGKTLESHLRMPSKARDSRTTTGGEQQPQFQLPNKNETNDALMRTEMPCR